MLQFKTPGVYVEEINSLPRSVSGVATAVPVFIGHTAQGVGSELYRKPTRIKSILDYIELFGKGPATQFELMYTVINDEDGNLLRTKLEHKDPVLQNQSDAYVPFVNVPKYNMYYAIQMYFKNGGGPCYIMSIGDYTEDPEDTYSEMSVWNALELVDEPTLIVMPDAVSVAEPDDTDITTSAASVYGAIVDLALAHCKKMQDRFLIADVINAYHPKTVTANVDDGTGTLVDNDFSYPVVTVTGTEDIDTHFRNNITMSPSDLKYGAVYYPYLKSTLGFEIDSASIQIYHQVLIQNTDGTLSVDDDAVLTYDDKALDDLVFQSDDVRPLVLRIRTLVENERVVVAPSSAMAGLYVETDSGRGVWQSPANIGVRGITGPMVNVTNDFNDHLNDHSTGKSVNPIRTFTGRGTLVWGGRTLNAGDLNWRFINVRREVIFIEESIKKALESYVFEPNTSNTWVKVKTMINSFLTSIWKAGGLAGERAEDAFEVSIGVNLTMTPEDIAAGIMVVEVKLVPPRPAEIIVLRVSQRLQTS